MTTLRLEVAKQVQSIVDQIPVVDIHTHIFDPAFGSLCLWGIDELLTYHYLAAEVLRARPDIPYATYWSLGKRARADLVWDELFVKRSPVSEACRGVVTVLHRLGVDPRALTLNDIRKAMTAYDLRRYVDKVFALAGVKQVIMTNDPLDPQEREVWNRGFDRDPRFLGALRMDSALMCWPEGAARLSALGYAVGEDLSGRTLAEVRRYFTTWLDRINGCYMAISLPPDFTYPAPQSVLSTFMVKTVMPVARERGIPVALMIGVNKLVNPALKLAGDSVGTADVRTLERLAEDFPDVQFLVTYLARENQHALCVAARKFRNILPFGCWWFLNNPSLIAEMTTMRLELLGLGFTPQHSDARVLDQLIYKWDHSRALIGSVLAGKFVDLSMAGWTSTRDEIQRDVNHLMQPAWEKWKNA